MKPRLLFFILLSIFFPTANKLFAQYPGNVRNNLTFWLKADTSNWGTGKLVDNTGPANTVVRKWIDEKSSYEITNSSALRPTWYNGSSTGSSVDSLNYQAHVTFLASASEHLTNAATSPDLLGTAGTTIIVSNSDRGNNRSAITYYSNTLYRYQIKPKLWVQTNDGITAVNNSSAGYVAHPNFTAPVPSPSYASPANNARIVVSRGFAGTLTGRINATQPGSLRHSNALTYCPGIAAGVFIGANPTNSEYFDGKIAEVIFYGTTLADDSIRQVESYLAVKYGITLDQSGLDATKGYVNSTGTTIYSPGTDGTTYWRNIIGLGRDNNSGLYQKQSHEYDDSVKIYTGSLRITNSANTATLTNNTFLMTGSTGATTKLSEAAATASEHPGNVSIRMDREWKVINTGFTNTYTMTFKLNSSAHVYWGTGVLTLLVDSDDGNFTNATNISSGSNGITIAQSAGIITVTVNPAAVGAALPTNSTRYITPAATNGTLSFRLLKFDAVKAGNGINLNWQTADERDTDYFEAEKSTDKINWIAINRVPSNADAKGSGNYQLTDKDFFSTTIYYRIKQVTKSGKKAYSEIKAVKPGFGTLSIYPNPASDKIKISWDGNKKPNQVKIFNTAGMAVNVNYTINEGYAEMFINRLPKGVYILAFITDESVNYTKLIKE
jgi:Secretion system C-terminal sorting domain